VSDEKLWDESLTSRHLQVLYHQTSFHLLFAGIFATVTTHHTLILDYCYHYICNEPNCL